MLTDKKLLFSDNQGSITTANTAHDSTNNIDTGFASSNIGEGNPVRLVVQVGGTAFAGTGGTLTVALLDSADDSSFATVATLTSAIAVGSLTAGAEIVNTVLPKNLRRYLKLTYTTHASNAFSAGTIYAGLFKD